MQNFINFVQYSVQHLQLNFFSYLPPPPPPPPHLQLLYEGLRSKVVYITHEKPFSNLGILYYCVLEAGDDLGFYNFNFPHIGLCDMLFWGDFRAFQIISHI